VSGDADKRALARGGVGRRRGIVSIETVREYDLIEPAEGFSVTKNILILRKETDFA
jgi:hypothetical protein